MLRLLLAAALAASCRPGAAVAAAPVEPDVALDAATVKGYGINLKFLVAARTAAGGKAVVLAEHRAGNPSVLHVLDGKGALAREVEVDSPQLADFCLDAAGGEAFLAGSYGTRFYRAGLDGAKGQLVYSSLPERKGFRALPPVNAVCLAQGPAVYGVMYEGSRQSTDLGFAVFARGADPAMALSTAGLEKELGAVLAYVPHPRLESVLVVHKADAKAKEKRLTLAAKDGSRSELASAEDLVGVAWSPDGRRIAYVRRSQGKAALVVHEPGGQAREVLQGDYFAPVFLAGGRKLLAAKLDVAGKRARQTAWLVDIAGGTAEPLALPEGSFIYSAASDGSAAVVWGPWGLSLFIF